jgi:nucleoid-associated protein YejK
MNKTYRKKLTNDIGVVFNVTLTKEKNAKYITFYDSRFIKGFTKLGQQVSKYYMNTLLGKDGFGGSIVNRGLDLYGGVNDWYIDSKASNKLINWIEKTKHKLN